MLPSPPLEDKKLPPSLLSNFIQYKNLIIISYCVIISTKNTVSFLTDPFHYTFVKNAFLTSVLLAISVIPIGTFLVLRRMTLLGEAFSHGVIPGVILSIFISKSVFVMIALGMISGFLTSILARYVSSKTVLEEGSSFSGFYMVFFALSMVLLSQSKNSKQINAFLFGSIVSLDDVTIYIILGLTCITVFTLLLLRKALVIICFSKKLAQFTIEKIELIYFIFLILLSANMVLSFKVLGNMMSLGLMFLPVLSVRIWCLSIYKSIFISLVISFVSIYLGVLTAFYVPIMQTSASIVIFLGLFYFSSVILYIFTNKNEVVF